MEERKGCILSGADGRTNATLHVDVAWHDADLAFARRDNAGTVGANKAGLVLPEQSVLYPHHVL